MGIRRSNSYSVATYPGLEDPWKGPSTTPGKKTEIQPQVSSTRKDYFIHDTLWAHSAFKKKNYSCLVPPA